MAFHQARVGKWTLGELKAHLATLVDEIRADRSPEAPDEVSPLDVALALLGGEVEAFVLFARVGHLDPPLPDGKIPIAVLQRRSADPEVDEKIRATAARWGVES